MVLPVFLVISFVSNVNIVKKVITVSVVGCGVIKNYIYEKKTCQRLMENN